EQIRRMWNEPPEFCVYVPDTRGENEKWLSQQACRVTIELSKTFEWTLVDVNHAAESAMRIHLAEVDKFRATLSRGLNIVKSHHELLELTHKDIYNNRQ
ncbi:unnamed protein product, partial [Prorocentrum cordatum]